MTYLEGNFIIIKQKNPQALLEDFFIRFWKCIMPARCLQERQQKAELQNTRR